MYSACIQLVVSHDDDDDDDVCTLHILIVMHSLCIELAGCLPARYHCERYMIGSPIPMIALYIFQNQYSRKGRMMLCSSVQYVHSTCCFT